MRKMPGCSAVGVAQKSPRAIHPALLPAAHPLGSVKVLLGLDGSAKSRCVPTEAVKGCFLTPKLLFWLAVCISLCFSGYCRICV